MTEEPLHVDTETFYALAKATLDAGHAFRFRANGRSMRPTIHNGDVITIMPMGNYRLRLGDIALHRTCGGGMGVHRIIRTTHRGLAKIYYTRGDAFGANSERVEEEDILGRATQIERDERTLRIDRTSDRWRGLIWALRQTLAQHYRNATR